MTIKEKFLPRMYCFMGSGMLSNTYDENVAEQNAVECEEIADEFAIGFAEWLIKRQTNYFESLKELLKIYKKEKGL